jgi:hypothetical protein
MITKVHLPVCPTLLLPLLSTAVVKIKKETKLSSVVAKILGKSSYFLLS